MERIATAPRMHPLMAVAALSVITVCAAGTAALTGLLPSSKADVPAAMAVAPQQMIGPQQAFAAQQSGAFLAAPAMAAPTMAQEDVAPAPRRTVVTHVHKHVTEVHHVAAKPRHAHTYAAAPAPARASSPNYVGIGTGAVIGGLIGHQIGGGKGKQLATVAGVIGGGFLGNEIANRNK